MFTMWKIYHNYDNLTKIAPCINYVKFANIRPIIMNEKLLMLNGALRWDGRVFLWKQWSCWEAALQQRWGVWWLLTTTHVDEIYVRNFSVKSLRDTFKKTLNFFHCSLSEIWKFTDAFSPFFIFSCWERMLNIHEKFIWSFIK